MSNKYFKYFLLIIPFFVFTSLHAQNKSNRGKEFWLGYGFSFTYFNEPPLNQQQLVIYLSTDNVAANVTVSINGTAWNQTVNIPANTADASILIPKSGVNDARILTDGLSTKGIHIVSDVPIAAYAHVYAAMFSAATMLMPVETWGFVYHSVNFYQYTSNSKLPNLSPTTANGPDWYSWFYAVATEDNTRIEITPSDSTKNGWLPGQTYIINLNKGETYNVFGKMTPGISDVWAASKDMTGSKIISVAGADGNCHPIALFSGSSGIRHCYGDGGEFMQQQIFPAQAWGTRYLTYHTVNNTLRNITTVDINEPFRNYYRICVKDPTTIVKRDGVILSGLVNNFYYEYIDSVGGSYIEADKPVLVSQYMVNKDQCWQILPAQTAYGDPEMIYPSPIEQGQKSVLFYSSSNYFCSYVYVNILVPTNGISSLLVDGAAVAASQIKPHPTYPGYSIAIANLSSNNDAQHTITSDSAFTAIVYGLGPAESYGYNVGCNINNLNSYPGFKNLLSTLNNSDTVTCTHTPVTFSFKTAYRLTSLIWKLSQVGGGINPSTDSVINNPIPTDSSFINSRKYYTYTLQQSFTFSSTGTFYLPITYTSPYIDACANTENTTLKIIVKNGPTSNFTFNNPVCLNDSVYFIGTYNANGFNIINYLWSFDDLTTATTINTVKKFTNSGNQNVRFRVFADNGCVGDTIKSLNIFATPIAKFGVSNTACAMDSVLISDSSNISIGTIASWQYFFGDGTSMTRNSNSNFYHQYTNAGNYIIKLITISDNGCKSDTVYKALSIKPKPISKFVCDKNICLGDSIKFTDNSTIVFGNIVSWKWILGDGTSFTKFNNLPFYYKYNLVGAYIVELITASNNGCISDTFKLTVTVNNKPLVSITANGSPCVDSTFKFTCAILNNTNNPINWFWNFGDGTLQNYTSLNTFTHTYITSGNNIIVKNVVSYGAGCTSDTTSIIIPIINKNPFASFAINNATICANTDVQFTNTASTGITNWLWNFGDGIGNQVPPFTRTFANVGTYQISLVGSNGVGCNSNIATTNLTVNPNPTIDAGPDKLIAVGSATTLDANIANPANYNYLWTPATYLNATNILNPISTPTTNIKYFVTATDILSSCNATDSVFITPISKLYIPNVFSPNGDGKNDTWKIPAMALYPDALVTIFNRYGQIIFETKNYVSTEWDGKFNGINQPTGSYIYVIKFASGSVEKGTLTLIR